MGIGAGTHDSGAIACDGNLKAVASWVPTMMHQTDCYAVRMEGIDHATIGAPEAIERFISSASVILYQAVLEPMVAGWDAVKFDAINKVVSEAHGSVSIGLGQRALFRYTDHLMDYDNNFGQDALDYLSDTRKLQLERISLLEAIILGAQPFIRGGWGSVESAISRALESQSLKLVYRNGRFQSTEGPTIQKAVFDPFWDLVSGEKWTNVRNDMQVSIDVRDKGGHGPTKFAIRALESAIKIIAEIQSRTTGHEKGAANYIDDLIRQQDGVRFIDPWEGEILKRFFAELRNQDDHGAGLKPQIQISAVQGAWAIEFCMISIKSLIQRLG